MITAAVRSTLFALLFYPGTLLFAIATLAASLVGSRSTQATVRLWAAVHHHLVTHVLGIRLQLEGHIPEGRVLFAAKHQAMVETIELMRLVRGPIVVLKKELAVMPFFGWATRRYGVIPVDRGAGGPARGSLVSAGGVAWASARPVVIYPEGTRVRPGETPPLQAGFAALYRALDLPVVPIALDSGRLWGRGFIKHPGTIRFVIGEIIEPGLPRTAIEARVHAAINLLEA